MQRGDKTIQAKTRMSAGWFWKRGSQAATPSLALLSSKAPEGTVIRPRALGTCSKARLDRAGLWHERELNPEGVCGHQLCGQPGVSGTIDLKPPALRFINFMVSHLVSLRSTVVFIVSFLLLGLSSVCSFLGFLRWILSY